MNSATGLLQLWRWQSDALTTLQGKSHLCIPFLGIARPQPQFPHSCVCEQFIQSQDRSTYFLQQIRQTDCGNIYITHRRMNVEIGTETPIFLFWEYLFQNFGILSLQCTWLDLIHTGCLLSGACQCQAKLRRRINKTTPPVKSRGYATQLLSLANNIPCCYYTDKK